MPEGDTIHRTAVCLQTALGGKTLRSFDAPHLVGPFPRPGVRVSKVEARGKYLLMHFDDGAILETHMRMTGAWHLYNRGESWRIPRHAARVVLETDDGRQAVCFSAPHVRLIRSSTPGLPHGDLGPSHLGPDLCLPAPDFDEVVRRFGLCDPERLVADVLLDQRICCGVGNVYKSEVLHKHGIAPHTPVSAIPELMRRGMVTTAHRLLRRNLLNSRRVTTSLGKPALAVYGRAGRPCLTCGSTIMRVNLGRHARSTYWCPRCQPTKSGD